MKNRTTYRKGLDLGDYYDKRKTGIKRIEDGIESSSRILLYGSPRTGRTVFVMQFLWQGLQECETVAFDVMTNLFLD